MILGRARPVLSLLICVTVATGRCLAQDERAVAVLTKAGGKVTSEAGSGLHVDLNARLATKDVVAALAALPDVRVLDLGRAGVDDEAWRAWPASAVAAGDDKELFFPLALDCPPAGPSLLGRGRVRDEQNPKVSPDRG